MKTWDVKLVRRAKPTPRKIEVTYIPKHGEIGQDMFLINVENEAVRRAKAQLTGNGWNRPF